MSTVQERVEKRRSSWEVCAESASGMRAILDELEGYSGVYEETTALRRHLERIERACARGCATPARGEKAAEPEAGPIEAGGDPKTVARNLIAQIPLQKIFRDPALSDAFLSELMLALARESSCMDRRERQRQGIAQAKAQGVRFGRAKRPLPENFEGIRKAWRDGQFTLAEAASRCGMPKSTFYNAAQRVERAIDEGEAQPEPLPCPRKRRPAASAQIG